MSKEQSKDVAPELYKEIERKFRTAIALDPIVRSANKKANDRTLVQSDVWNYGKRVAKHAGDALRSTLTTEKLPDGKLYWNIATRTVEPFTILVYNMLADKMALAIEIMWRKQGIGLKAKGARLSKDRLSAFLNKLVRIEEHDDGK